MDWLERMGLGSPCQVLVVLLLPAIYFSAIGPTWALALGTLALLVWWSSARSTTTDQAPRQSVALLALAALLALGWTWRQSPPPQPVWPFAVEGLIEGSGTVMTEAPVSRRGAVSFQFRVEQVAKGDWSGRARASVKVVSFRGPAPPTGSRWRWTGSLGPDGTLLWSGAEQTGWSAWWWRWRAGVRVKVRETLMPLGEGPAALGEALLIGAVDDLTPGEKQSFRLAGCSHVLALSGMHLSLLALVLTGLLRKRAPAMVVFGLVQGTLALFCFVAGPLPSLMRAWVMSALAGWWVLTRQPVPLRELLAQSFLVTVTIWPEMASTLSLQLSFLAMAGLFWWGARWELSLRPWLGGWGATQMAASAAALCATVPLTAALFGEVRWIGLLMTPPLVFLTTIDLLGSALVVLAGSFIPRFDATGLAGAFQLLYDLTFGCTSWASAFPALPGTAVLVASAAGGLGATGFFLYNQRQRRAHLPESLNYDSPASLQTFLQERGYNALKRWGQNFLINAGARRQILAALELKPGEAVWEVGPGLGALTHHLVASGHPLTVFEIDPGYVGFLRDEFGGAAAGFEVVEGDVIKTWKSVAKKSVKTVGNLPYNAASAIVADFVEGGFFPEVFVVTVQLEMAQRMTATPGNKNYSSFSVLCQSAFRLDDVVTLRPGSFYPAPEVTSRVVRLRPHHLYPGLDHKGFSTLVRECFSSRRKTLRNNLPRAAAALNVAEETLSKAFENAGIDLGLRAETLKVAQFVAVFQALDPTRA